jgi:predicted  nucleic acid-binding Zn-ribbon protein
MNYSLEMIDTVQGCNTLLVQAQRRKQKLEHKRSNLGEKIDLFRRQMDKIDQEIELTQTSLAAFTAASVAMPEGKDKMNMVIKVKRLEVQHVVLKNKANSYGLNALLAKEMEYVALEGQVSVVEQYIIDIETRIATLGQPGLSVSQALAVSHMAADASAKTTEVISDEAWIDAYLDGAESFLKTTEKPRAKVIKLIYDKLTNTFVPRRSGWRPKPPGAAKRKRKAKQRP